MAIFTVLCLSAFMFGVAALSVDVARWYLEGQRTQRAADAGALGGVSYLPQDMANATVTAKAIASRNGYLDGTNGATVTTGTGTKKSQLQVTVCGTVPSIFGGILGINSAVICRTAVADYTGPAPLGSPCNTFGNEPTGGGGTASPTPSGTALASTSNGRFSNCKQNPQFWATIEGPTVDKVQGDRFQTLKCAAGTSTDGCDGSKNNSEYDPAGYFWLIHVQPAAVNKSIDLQLYDPGFVYQGQGCEDLDPGWTSAANAPNDYVNDARTRYSPASATTKFGSNSSDAPYACPGDSFPGTAATPLVTTSFALRQQTDTLNPRTAAVQTADGSGADCIRQYKGSYSTRTSGNSTVLSGPTVAQLSKANGSYNDAIAKEFHNWVSFCKFTPARSGDYYLQVRTNVAAGGTALDTNSIAYAGNQNVLKATGDLTSGYGANSFGIRAVTASGSENQVSVSGYDKMPIYMNADGTSAQFNLIRVLPGAAGKAISFSYFDVGDAADGTGSVAVKMPADAKTTSGASYSSTTTQFPNGCKAVGGYANASGATYNGCSAPFTGGSNGTNNGKLETISIPIPTDYTCNYNSLGGCWYQVVVTFPSSSDPSVDDSVHDTTTWTADIVGQPVRLIE